MMVEVVDLEFCRKLPKIELHAHIGGSLSSDTIKKLMLQKPHLNNSTIATTIEKGQRRTMQEGFMMFKLIHDIVDSAAIVTDITKDVIADFAQDGVQYLELRSTPRDIVKTGLTKKLYIESVLQGIKEYHYEHANENNIEVCYLPSVDRSRHPNEGIETVKLAEEYMHVSSGVVIGIDFSGNPYKGNASDFTDILLCAKNAGLKLSVHAAEVSGQLDDDRKLLSLPLDRIGHGTYILEDQALHKDILERQIPLELCLTSNFKTKTCPEDFKKHHMTSWRNKECQHPCVICTDDKGIFATSLSNEYMIAAEALDYTKRDMAAWAKEAIDYAFVDETTKQGLRMKFEKKCSQFFSECM